MIRKIISTAALACLLFASCSMVNTTGADVIEDSKGTYIKIALKYNERTALPVIDSLNEFDSFSLSGKIEGEEVISKSFTKDSGYTYVPKSNIRSAVARFVSGNAKSAYEKLSAEEVFVEAGTTYEFTLSAVKGSAVWEGSTSITPVVGENTISFTLSLVSLFNGTEEDFGTLSVELTLPSTVHSFIPEIYYMDGTSPVIYTAPETGLLPLNNDAEENYAYYRNSLPVGNYVLIFNLYGDSAKTLKIGQWREYAGIASNVRSVSSPRIESADDLENIYSINIDVKSGSLSGTFPGSYTRYSDEIILPESDRIQKNSFVFKGWEETDDEGNESGSMITSISAGSTGNVYVQASWEESGIHADAVENEFHINADVASEGVQIVAW